MIQRYGKHFTIYCSRAKSMKMYIYIVSLLCMYINIYHWKSHWLINVSKWDTSSRKDTWLNILLKNTNVSSIKIITGQATSYNIHQMLKIPQNPHPPPVESTLPAHSISSDTECTNKWMRQISTSCRPKGTTVKAPIKYSHIRVKYRA